MTARVGRALYDLLSSRTRDVQTVRAVVGDGCGNTAVAGDANFIWIRPYNREYPFPAYCAAGTQMPYDAVVVAEVHHVGGGAYYVIKGTDPEIYARGTPASVPTVGPHAMQHMYEMGGGDVVYIHSWQMSSLRVVPSSPPGLKVFVAPGEWWLGGTLHSWPGGESGDLTSYLPSASHVVYLVVYINSSFDSIGYQPSPEYSDNPFMPEIDELNIPTPPGVIAAGIVKLHSDTTEITTDLIYPIRTFITPDSAAEIAQHSLFLAAATDALYKSVAGLYTWVQIGSAIGYLTAGITGLAVCSAEDWIVFRQQATASVDDPLVYRTLNAGLSWAQAQDGISFTQGSDLWKVYAVWRDPTNPYRIAIAISRISVSTTPLIFYTEDGAENWVEIDNTGLPTFTCNSFTFPRCIGVRTFNPPVMCIALGEEGMYFKNDTSNWTEISLDSEDVHAVREDWLSDGYWTALTTSKVHFTENNWSAFTSYQLDNVDGAAPDACNIYQNMTDRRIFTFPGIQGLHTTWSRAAPLLAAPPLGEPGTVLWGVPGATSMLLLTNANGDLFLSTDFGLSSLMALGREDVVAADGVAPYGTFPETEAEPDFEICKAWMLGS